MRVLVINGSPKGAASNTYRLTSAFVEGLSAAVPCEVKTLEVAHLEIAPCRGCFACWDKTPGQCVMHDDMAQVIAERVWADVTIWSFPLYYFGVPAPLKALIDRQLPMNLPFMAAGAKSGGHPSRYDMSGKCNVVISTCGFYTAEGNYDSVCAMFDHFCGAGQYEKILCGEGELFRVPELSARTDEYLAAVRRAGEEFAHGGIAPATHAELDQLLYPREAFEAMADASWGVGEDGQKEDDSLTFTKQMAALYNKASWKDHDRVLQMNYTDIGRTFTIVLGQEGSHVAEGAEPAFTTRVNTPLSVWQSIARGEVSGTDAMMRHLYTVDGEFDLMAHWDDYFGAGAETSAATASSGAAAAPTKTSWLALLLPWTMFWSLASINPYWGSLATIAVCAALPVVLRRTRRTTYDALSAGAAMLFSAALLAGASDVAVLVASYLMFGAMWLGSCFTKVPLTAHYSMNSYGGEKAWSNAVFVRTNLILTAGWGVLYLLQAVLALVLGAAGMVGLVAVASWALPSAMGVFTAWFQRWYPARVARG